uniref:Uncharacterized protein n=1 Tax=Romanomermis culicivorax TaxID=13658 RepID=A0A915L6X0_ROMCU
MVVAMADIRAVGSRDVAVSCSDVEDGVAGSTSIGGRGGSGTLNTNFRGFFKASKRFWISALCCNRLI